MNNKAKYKTKVSLKVEALSIRDYTIIEAVQATYHQSDIKYSTSRSIQCSCMSLISVSLMLFESPVHEINLT